MKRRTASRFDLGINLFHRLPLLLDIVLHFVPSGVTCALPYAPMYLETFSISAPVAFFFFKGNWGLIGNEGFKFFLIYFWLC